MTAETHPHLHANYAERGMTREAWLCAEITRQADEWRKVKRPAKDVTLVTDKVKGIIHLSTAVHELP